MNRILFEYRILREYLTKEWNRLKTENFLTAYQFTQEA